MASSEGELRDHRGRDVLGDPSAEKIVAHLLSRVGAEPGAIVLDDPFPGMSPSEFSLVLGALAHVATEHLVIYVIDQLALVGAMIPRRSDPAAANAS